MRLLFFILSLTITINLSAQEAGSITVTGKVLDKSTRKPLEFASIFLLNPNDSSLVTGGVSEASGDFYLENVTAGTYLLRLSFFGYEKKDTLFTVPEGEKKVNIGRCMLGSSSIALKEAVITHEKEKLMDISIDKKTYNVGQDVQSASGSASDILKNIPSVDVDIDGEVSLRGSGGVIILVNGNLSPMMKGKSRAEALQQLPAGSIEKIEVITNPSAKYRPDGTSGIINIILKKNTRTGINGSVTLSAGNNDRYTGNTLVNYKPGKLNIYAGLGMRQNRYIRYGDIDRNNLDSVMELSTIYREDNTSSGKSLSSNASLGMDYDMNARNKLSFSGDYFHFGIERGNVSSRLLRDKTNTLISHYERRTDFSESTSEGELALVYEHKFEKEEHTLEVEMNAAFEDENEYRWNSNVYFFPDQPAGYDNIFSKKKDNPKEINVDYSYPVSEDAALEAGYAGNYLRLDIDYTGEYIDSMTGLFAKNPGTSYRYLYDDRVHAVYGTWEQEIEDFGVMAGLRLEQANLEGKVATIDSVFTNSYLSLYPSLHLGYEIENGQLQLSYSRRISRPDGDELNPFPEYDDPRNLYAGNPKLLPEYVHAVEMGVELQKEKYSFVPALYYRYTTNGFTDVTYRINDSTLLTTMQNLANDQSAGMEMILSGKPAGWLSGNLTGNIFYNQIDASNLGFSSKKSIISFNTRLNANISFATYTMMQVTGNYRSARLSPQGEYSPTFYLNLGLKQDFFKNTLALTLTLSDIFNTQRREMKLDSQYFNQTSVSTRDSRIVFLGLRYRFGSLTKKQKEEALQFDNDMR